MYSIYAQCGAVITCQFSKKNIRKKHPIAQPLGQGMGWLLWIQYLNDNLMESFIEHLTILDRVIMALNCILFMDS